MTTLRDVAALAGVSTATASLALNGGPVKEITRQAVKVAAAQLNYVPNRAGQMLMSGRSKAIEMVILTADRYPNIVRRTSLFYYLMEGVLAIADQHGFAVRFAVKSHDDAGLLAYFANLGRSGIVDGAVIIPQFSVDAHFTSVLKEAGLPHVLLRPAAFGTDANYVDMGNHEGGRLVAELLTASGARRVGIINGPPTHFDAIERERGFTSALLDGGGALVAKVNGDFTIESGYAAMQDMARRLPDAVFCANDYMAAGAMKYLKSIGVRVPEHVALVGYDNNDIVEALDPDLTTVDNRFFDLGTALATNLFVLMDTPDEHVTCKLLPRLILRRSHGGPA